MAFFIPVCSQRRGGGAYFKSLNIYSSNCFSQNSNTVSLLPINKDWPILYGYYFFLGSKKIHQLGIITKSDSQTGEGAY